MHINFSNFENVSNFQKLGTSELSSLNNNLKNCFELNKPKIKEIKYFNEFCEDFDTPSDFHTVTKGEYRFVEQAMTETLYIRHEVQVGKNYSENENVFADLAEKYNSFKEYYESKASDTELTERMKMLDKIYDDVLSTVVTRHASGMSIMEFHVQQTMNRHNTCLVTGEGNYNSNGLGHLDFDSSGFGSVINFVQKKIELSVKAMGQYAKELIRNGNFDLSTDSGKEEFQSALDQYAKSNNFLDRTDFKNLNELADSISNLERSGDKKLVLSKINTFSKMKFSASFINMLNDYFDLYLRWYDSVGSKGSYFTWK